MSEIEKGKIAKADLVHALKDGFGYCDHVYADLTDAKLADTVKVEGRTMSVLTVLTLNTAHNDEHYGNIVTYMRL